MAKIQVSVSVEDSGYNLAKNLGTILVDVIQKKGTPVLLADAMAGLQSDIAAVGAVGADIKDDAIAFGVGVELGLKESLAPLYVKA
jgi:hypothetical protein